MTFDSSQMCKCANRQQKATRKGNERQLEAFYHQTCANRNQENELFLVLASLMNSRLALGDENYFIAVAQLLGL